MGSGTVSRWPARIDALGPAEVGAGDDRIAVADQLQLRKPAEGMLHGVGQRPFVAGDAVDVDQGGRQQGHVLAQVKGYGGGSAITIQLYRRKAAGFERVHVVSIDLGHD